MGRAFDQAEYDALREFFAAWEAFHGLKNAKTEEKQKAATLMVEKAKIVQRMQRA